MFAHKFYEGRRVRLPIRRKALQIFEDRVDPRLVKECNGILGIFVKIGIENPLVYEIRFATDVEEDPSQIVKSERGENKRIAGYSSLYFFAVRSDHFFATRFDLCDERESIIGRRLRINGP